MQKNFKIYLIFFLCVVIILGVWLYTLKLNLTKSNDGSNDGLKKIFQSLGSIGDSFKNIPTPPQTSTTTPQDVVVDEVSNKLLNLTSTSTPTSTQIIFTK